MALIITVIIYACVYISLTCGEVIFQTPNGPIKGNTQQTRAGVTYYEFLGVRYGQSPTNELRLQVYPQLYEKIWSLSLHDDTSLLYEIPLIYLYFWNEVPYRYFGEMGASTEKPTVMKPPKPVEPWEGVFDATVEKGICFQVPKDYEMETEDCLLLNLFTPVDSSQNTSAGLPVMFFIHGGGFVEGTGIRYWGVGPYFFMEYETILVAINYRLGPFGYLSTGDDVIPGNLGMKDQLLALQWVQENIASFGGDPEKVTIFGQSAGGASVSYLLLSPLAEGLFRAAILESGSALNPWAYQRDQIEITYETAALLNPEFKENRNSTHLLQFLQNISARELDEASYNLTKKLTYPGNIQLSKGFYYTPVVEHEHENAFLTKLPYEAYENGDFIKVPVLIGFNAEESLFMLTRTLHRTLKAYDENPSYVVPFDMHVTDENVLNEIGDLIKKFYTPDTNWEDNKLAGIQYHSNQDFDRSVIKQVELQAPYVPVYFYEFTYSGLMGNNPRHLNGSGAVGHAEEQNYIFSRWLSLEIPDNSDFSKFPQDDVNVHYYFITFFTNFAKELNPTPTKDPVLQNIIWPLVQKKETLQYLEIGKDLIIHNNAPKEEMWNFWNNLYDTYAKRPYDSW